MTHGVRSYMTLTTLGLLVLADIVIAGATLSGLLVMLIIFTIVVPMGFRRLDLFEPIVLANISLGLMFIGRPLADLASETTSHLGYDITHTFDEALLVVFVGVLAFQVGYFSPFGSIWARKLRGPPPFRPQRAMLAAWLFFALGGLLFGLFLIQGGGFGLLLFLLSGRSTQDNAIFLGASGYFYSGILMWAASALIFFAFASALGRRINFLWFLLMVLPLVVFFGARGTRSQLLPLVLAVPTFWYLWKRRRPSLRLLLTVAIIGISLIGWQREIRRAGTVNRVEFGTMLLEALISPVQQFGDILNGADNEMFDSMTNLLIIVPDKMGYQPGGAIADLFIRAVPRQLWPDKPLELNDAVIKTLWPEHYSRSRASAAFSIIAPFYTDSGYIGVAIGMFLIGAALATSWQWYLLHRDNLSAVLIYSMTLPFVVILMRGTLPDTLYRMLYMVVPLVLLMWASRFRRRSRGIKARSVQAGRS